MIVSHKHRFIFLKTRKTAGTSIEVVLSQIAGEDAIVTPVNPPEAGHEPRNYLEPGSDSRIRFINHLPALVVRNRLGEEVWDGYFKFCFERNPWEKVASLYGWRFRGTPDRPEFDEWLSSDSGLSDLGIYFIDDECAVDAIGRYERLDADFGEILSRLGIAETPSLPRAKSGAHPEGGLYSTAAVERVRKIFHREIELFGYECPPHLLARVD